MARLRARWERQAAGRRRLDLLELMPAPDVAEVGAVHGDGPAEEFGGGAFGGGGAGGRFELPGDGALRSGAPSCDDAPAAPTPTGKGLLDLLDADDAWPLVLVAAVAVAGVAVGAYVVWTAPVLLAELVLDAVVAGAAYRRVRRLGAPPWPWAGVRQTWAAAVALVLSVGLVGWAAAWVHPGADSIGDLFASR